MNHRYIAIEGNIGAGKTTFAKMLAERLDGRLLLEEFADNPFLSKFYEQPDRHAFSVELFFLADRYHQLREELSQPSLFQEVVIADYFIAKSLIFAGNNLRDDEYDLFHRLFEIMFNTMPKPDLLVYLYLNVDRLLANIKKRGRAYEQNIQREYLESVQERYLRFIREQTSLTVLIVDINNLNFVDNPKDFDTLLGIIGKKYNQGVHTVVAEASH